ncbi:MAG: hypothetical protein UY16_C0023G0008 [Candidatus Gottesmanbacteria bacterium GW2011_GWA2_47_9]|uniref:O-antigen ligase-related domain-containing protein n=1 Tax=Candidatus Gottesmanbacteria bacterium GW2011_GWA2_47_9 TaxID=1618445 RepID=A0A0G1U0H2_9BACT|nr:MAG: hypothetical protein UY16_C0023G0008 [Candidatus Gottesmanbacteria bacterium GW2011_GWA2_47_9]
MNLVLWCNRVIKIGFYLLFILIPLILTPWNYELFEYNKMMVTYALTIIIVGAWAIKMVAQKEMRIAKTPLDIPIALFLSSQLLSSLFSMDPHVSWFGYYSRFNGGMLSIISYVLLYYALVSNWPNLSNLTNLLKVALGTAVAVALYGVAERLGIDKSLWVQDVQNRVFSTLGQPNWLAAYLVALTPIAMAMGMLNAKWPMLNKDTKHFLLKYFLFSIFHLALVILFFLVLLFTRSRSGLLAFAVADIVFWSLVFIRPRLAKQGEALRNFLIVHFAFFLIVFLNGTYVDSVDKWLTFNAWKSRVTVQRTNERAEPSTNEAPAAAYTAPLLETGGTQSSVIRKYVWQGAINAWKSSTKTFLIGTGTETFAYAFYQFRPVGHNMTSEWDFLYNKAHNEYLNYLTTTGIFGLGSYLLFIAAFAWWLVKFSIFNFQFSNKKEMSNYQFPIINYALFAGWISVLVTNFFGFSVVIVQLFLFLFPAMAIASHQSTADSRGLWKTFPLKLTPQVSKWTSLSLLLALFMLLFFLGRMWWADVLFAQGYRLARNGAYAQAQSLNNQAITISPAEPLYHDEYSTTLAALAALAVEQKQATLAATMIGQALTESDKAITISPKNVNFWKSRTKIFYSFSAFDPEFNPAAITALTRAWELSPNDPKIIYNLAILYGRQNDNTKAIELLQQAINLKPNYRDAYFALHVFYKEIGNSQKAREVVETYLQKVDPNDRDFQTRL